MSKAPVIIRPRDVFRTIRYKPHKGQVRFHLARNHRNRVLPAGRRFGKSSAGGAELAIEAHATRFALPRLEEEGKRREFWIVGPEYSDAEKEYRFLYNRLKAAGAPFDKPGTYYDPHSGDMQLSMYEGKFMVLGKSAKHPERLVGEGLSGVIMAEAAKMKESTWSKYIRATLADFKGWSIFNSTPEGKNWFYDLYMAGLDKTNPDWWAMRAPGWMNPFVYPLGATDGQIATLRAALDEGGFDWHKLVKRLGIDPEIAQMVRDLTDETFNQEIGAQFNEFAGRVFKDFDEETHVGDYPFDPGRPLTCAAVDYGFTNPFVWLLIQEDVWGNVYVVDEMYERGLTIDECAAEVDARNLCPQQVKTFYPDPASPGDTRALERHLKIRSVGGTGGELNRRLRYIRAALKVRNQHLPWDDPERKPKLFINKRCTNTIREMGQYRYPESKKDADRNENEAPLKKDDHTPEALGRFYGGHYGAPEDSAPGATRISRANVGLR